MTSATFVGGCGDTARIHVASRARTPSEYACHQFTRIVLGTIFGLSVLLAGGEALATAPTTPQSIVGLYSFNPATEGSYPVPGLTLDGAKGLWGVLSVPRHGSFKAAGFPGHRRRAVMAATPVN